MVEGVQGEAGPGVAGDLCDGEEGTPIVGEAIEGGGWKRWVAGFEGLEIVGGPAGEFAAEFVFEFGALVVKAGRDFVGLGLYKGDENGAIVKRAGKRTNAGESGGAEGPERTDGVAFTVATVSARAALVAGVEETAKFFGLREPGVHFIEEQCGLVLVDEAEQDGGGQIFGAEGTGCEGGNEIEGGGFAAAGFGGGEIEPGTLGKSAETMGVG